MDTTPSSPIGPSEPAPPTETDTPQAGPSAPAAPRRAYTRKPKEKQPRGDEYTSYTTAYVPGLYNVKNPAGDFMQKESNIEVRRQVVLAKRARDKAAAEEEAKLKGETGDAAAPNGDVSANGTPTVENGTTDEKKDKEEKEKAEERKQNRLKHILIIHPGSRNLRIGRASDFYPHEVPNCIARLATDPGGVDPPVLGKRTADDMDSNIHNLRDYLRNKLRANKLVTDWRDGTRVNAANAKSKPEPIPEHNDPYRVEWTELEGRRFFVGTEALRLADSSGFRVRYPIHQRGFNSRDWASHQLLLDDITLILQETLRTELDIKPVDYKKYSVVFIVPDFGNRVYIEEMTNLILNVLGFKEIAIHQESYCAVFSAGMSSACVVDVGAQETSVTVVEEGLVNQDTRMSLSYGGDDVTVALAALLQRASFPYRDLDLARTQDWLMMDNLKIKVCTLEEHLVANTPWDCYVVQEKGLTNKYLFRTYDENILAPLSFFDTRMIDFDTKREETFKLVNPDVTDLIKSPYGEPTGAMKSCTTHLLPSRDLKDEVGAASTRGSTPVPAAQAATAAASPAATPGGTPGPGDKTASFAPATAAQSTAATPAPEADPNASTADDVSSFDIVYEASKTPLDAAIAASISMASSENKVKTAASSILLVGGGSALKGLAPFIADRLPALLRQRGYPIDHVQIVPPPRGLNPKFMSWKGASVMCNLESLSDMWIGPDELEDLGPRTLKDRLIML